MEAIIYCERQNCMYCFGEECQRTEISLDENGKCRCYKAREKEG